MTGITLWVGVFGGYPFNGPTQLQLYESIENDELEFPTQTLQVSKSEEDRIPVDKCVHLVEILRQMLQKVEEDRISVQEVSILHPT